MFTVDEEMFVEFMAHVLQKDYHSIVTPHQSYVFLISVESLNMDSDNMYISPHHYAVNLLSTGLNKIH